MLYLGNKKIGTLYYNGKNIKEAYYGSTLVYSSFTPKTFRFDYTGAVQEFVVPSGVNKLIVDAVGGAGGNDDIGPGGRGGRAQCNLNVFSGQKLYIYVGGVGTDRPSDKRNVNGGFNGGGIGGNYFSTGGAGGGATDIRTVKASDGSWYITNHSSWDTDNSLLSRLVVAGGGGGCNESRIGGGAGGGLIGGSGSTGYSGVTLPTGGTQTSGGTAGRSSNGTAYPGFFGGGGDGFQINTTEVWGGGGGGGWYGGGSGSYASGAGGSSYTHPTQCTNVTHTQGYSQATGNGWLIITTSR